MVCRRLHACRTTEDLADSKSQGDSLLPDHNKLKEGPLGYIPTGKPEDASEEFFQPVFRFVDKYVTKAHGIQYVNKWLKDNKGKTLLHLITASDIAKAVVLMKNNECVWEEDYKVNAMSDEEQEAYTGAAGYTNKKPLYSSGANKKRTFCGVMWSRAGIEFFEDAEQKWKDGLKDERIWVTLLDGWHNYVNRTKCNRHWKRKKRHSPSRDADEEDARRSAAPVVVGKCFLEGDAGFDGGRTGSDYEGQRETANALLAIGSQRQTHSGGDGGGGGGSVGSPTLFGVVHHGGEPETGNGGGEPEKENRSNSASRSSSRSNSASRSSSRSRDGRGSGDEGRKKKRKRRSSGGGSRSEDSGGGRMEESEGGSASRKGGGRSGKGKKQRTAD